MRTGNGARAYRSAVFRIAFAGLALFLSACRTNTRISGALSLGNSQAAPDSDRHTLYVAAFSTAAFQGATFVNTAATPVFVEFGGIANGDFDPKVTYQLEAAGDAREVGVVVWWKVGKPEQVDYLPPEPGDRFGVFPLNPIFRGEDGTKGGAQAASVDIVLDQVFVTPVRVPFPHGGAF